MDRRRNREKHAAAAVVGFAVSGPTARALCHSTLPVDTARQQLSLRGCLSDSLPRRVPPLRCCSVGNFLPFRTEPNRLLSTCDQQRLKLSRLGAASGDASPAAGDRRTEQNDEGGEIGIDAAARASSHLSALTAMAAAVAEARARAVCLIDNNRELEEKRAASRRMRRKTKAKIRAIPAGSSSQRDGWRIRNRVSNVNFADARAAAASGLRNWGAAVGDVVVRKPLGYLRRKVNSCKSFIASRERIHWVSLAMATYIVATSPLSSRLERSPFRTDGNYRGSPEDALSGGLLGEFSRRPHGIARRWRDRPRFRADAYSHRHGAGGHTGDLDATITHFDDHAEKLWRDSPTVRAAAKAAARAAAAAKAAAEDSLAPGVAKPANPQPIRDGKPLHDEGIREGAPASTPMITGVPDMAGEPVATEGDGNADESSQDLRTYIELRDLELAAEKALDLLPDRDDVGNGGGADSCGPNQRAEGTAGAVAGRSAPDEYGGARVDVSDGVEGSKGGGERLDAIAESPPDSCIDDGTDSPGTGEGAHNLPSSPSSSSFISPTLATVAAADGELSSPGGSVSASECAPDELRHGVARGANSDQEEVTEADAAVSEGQEVTSATPSDADSSVTASETDMKETVTPILPNTALPRPSPVSGPESGEGGGGGRGRHSTSFVAVAARAVSPAVCRIDMERLVETGQDVPVPDVEVGQGSGVIFSSEDGLVLTNAHVVAGARKVTVTLTDGRKFLAEVKGTDELSDLAVLKIDKDVASCDTPLPAATLGDSQELQVGDWVIAVGNPVGLDSTVTLGIVSSMKRSSEEVGFPERKVTFIQTDAAINPGNSGGPLVNEFGEVVGINTAIRAHTEGIGFAIPINKAKAIMHDLAEGNRIEYAYIGIHMTTITPDFALQNNRDPNSHQLIPEVNGVIIMRVLPNTPASEAGLRRHDVVIEMRGKAVRTADEAKQVVDESMVGDVLTVKVLRGLDRVVELEVRTRDVSERLGLNALESTPKHGSGGGDEPLKAPRFELRPFPGAAPPAFP